jgi:2-polyprenyl-3-methyl-5-hydroxy-6-metoxy-1,4-benzoquinol methylase
MKSEEINPLKSNFDSYLTEHLSHTIDPKSRVKKKQWIERNYLSVLPQNLDARILEVGPGHGELLEFLIQDMQYKNVIGVDISGEVVEYCNDLIPGSTLMVDENYQYFNDRLSYFDCIVMLHVLEHVPKHRIVDFLAAIHNSLKPGGFLIIEVPNMANLLVGLNFRYADFTHEVGFTDASLKYVLRRAGFSEIAVSPVSVPIGSIARRVQYLLQNVVNKIIALILKIYIPSSRQITSSAIYAVSTKRE